MHTLSLAKYELLPSVDDLLDPQTLSDLVRSSIKRMRRSPFLERPGASNNGFEWVTTVSNSGAEGHYVLTSFDFRPVSMPELLTGGDFGQDREKPDAAFVKLL